jgi:methenyltetrahydrofolate cyclohydrolase
VSATEGLRSFLDEVASPEPLPAGGAAAAAVAALAAALLAQVSARRGLEELVDEAEHLRRRATELVAEDVSAYRTALDVSRWTGSEDDRARSALSAAADPPLAVAEVAARVTELARTVSGEVDGPLRADAAVSARLASAASAAAAGVVRANLRGEDDPRVRSARVAVDRAEAVLDELDATLP